MPVTIQYTDGSPEQEIQLVAGFIGVKQDHETLALQPHIGWSVIAGAEVVRPAAKA